MVPVSIRMPEDVIDDLKRIAPQLGFSGYQPLIRAYIGQGLRQISCDWKTSWASERVNENETLREKVYCSICLHSTVVGGGLIHTSAGNLGA